MDPTLADLSGTTASSNGSTWFSDLSANLLQPYLTYQLAQAQQQTVQLQNQQQLAAQYGKPLADGTYDLQRLNVGGVNVTTIALAVGAFVVGALLIKKVF